MRNIYYIIILFNILCANIYVKFILYHVIRFAVIFMFIFCIIL